MISRSDFQSIPESAGSLDYRVKQDRMLGGSVVANQGDLYVRLARDTDSEVLRSAEESEGPPDYLEEKIREWKKHVKEFATGSGFRKASKIDPRKLALHLSRLALRQSQKYGSRSLERLGRRLRWAAERGRPAAERALRDIAQEDDDTDSVGRSRIEKPQGTIPPELPEEEESAYPGATGVPLLDRSWGSEKTGSRRRAQDDRPKENADLVQYALDFMDDYRSTNSLLDEASLLDALSQSEVFESWLVDLDAKGVLADPTDLDDAWNRALSEMTGEEVEEPGEIITSKKEKDDPRIQPFIAPGGDWANTILRSEDNPQLDRYLRKDNPAQVYSRRKAGGKITKAVDQCLDHFAGEMVPSEISPEHVQQFMEEDFPGVPWKPVYEAIQEIADPRRRHEKERTNEGDGEDDEKKRKESYYSSRRRLSVISRHESSFDSATRRRISCLQEEQEICTSCRGTGHEVSGSCLRCAGSGRVGVDMRDSRLLQKERLFRRLGSLLVVEVKAHKLSPGGRRELGRLTKSRVASRNLGHYFHTPQLMQFLVKYDVPYQTSNYKHPNH